MLFHPELTLSWSSQLNTCMSVCEVCSLMLKELEQLERLHSENVPPLPHDYPYYWFILVSSQNMTKSKLQIWSICPNFKFWNFVKKTLYITHLLKLLDKMCKYEMDPVSIVEDTEWTQFCPQTNRPTDGQGETSIPRFQLRWRGGGGSNSMAMQTQHW